MQGNKFSEAPPALNWMRRLEPRTKLCLLMASFVMVLLPESPQVVSLAALMVLRAGQQPGPPETPLPPTKVSSSSTPDRHANRMDSGALN